MREREEEGGEKREEGGERNNVEMLTIKLKSQLMNLFIFLSSFI